MFHTSVTAIILLVSSLGNSVLFLLYLGFSCRTRVTKHLSPQSKTLSEAEDALQIDYLTSGFYFGNVQPSSTPQSATVFITTPFSIAEPCLNKILTNSSVITGRHGTLHENEKTLSTWMTSQYKGLQ